MDFEWDPNKAASNFAKHQVTFEEASTVFADPNFSTFLDDEHSLTEERYITVGLSQHANLLMVAHVHRGERIRIISARKATSHEQQVYIDS